MYILRVFALNIRTTQEGFIVTEVVSERVIRVILDQGVGQSYSEKNFTGFTRKLACEIEETYPDDFCLIFEANTFSGLPPSTREEVITYLQGRGFVITED